MLYNHHHTVIHPIMIFLRSIIIILCYLYMYIYTHDHVMFIPFNTEFIVAFPSPHHLGKKSPGSQAVCGSLPRPYGNSPSFLGSFFFTGEWWKTRSGILSWLENPTAGKSISISLYSIFYITCIWYDDIMIKQLYYYWFIYIYLSLSQFDFNICVCVYIYVGKAAYNIAIKELLGVRASTAGASGLFEVWLQARRARSMMSCIFEEQVQLGVSCISCTMIIQVHLPSFIHGIRLVSFTSRTRTSMVPIAQKALRFVKLQPCCTRTLREICAYP